MTTNTAIEWADHTFNPWIGCTKVSPACDHCYAEQRMDKRLHVVQWGVGQPRKRTSAANWRTPLAWERNAAKFHADHGRRQRVFCASLADVFDNEIDPDWRADLFALIGQTRSLDWLLLTKRIGNVRGMVNEASKRALCLTGPWSAALPSNVWLGATICNQKEADRDIPKLLATPAAKRFLSIEPMLGPIDLTDITMPGSGHGHHELSPIITGNALKRATHGDPALDWIICGGESGPNARPMHPDWPRSLRAQCNAAGVPFFFKQWGEWEIASIENGHFDCDMARNAAHWVDLDGSMHKPSSAGLKNAYAMVRVGKKAAGRLLDGRTWDEVPA